ncbi:MAG: cytochrome b/b6 domain-containing protein [Deltaproteobacteria bacterium]|nr:cytochrome b/b6 domain-containing protein [Deltaproteobacteria bacterium]
MAKPRRPQPLLIRITHWINVPVLAILAMSGLQIFLAYPFFGPRGAEYDWVPLSGWMPPEWIRAGGWLAGARHLHFAFMWVLVINAAIYVIYLAASGEWRRRLLWRNQARQRYNRLQRAAYTGALVLGIAEVLSGLAMWKPVQLHRLTWLMGGFDGARVIHFLAMLGLFGFVIGHVIMVIVHWRKFPEMITGGKREDA